MKLNKTALLLALAAFLPLHSHAQTVLSDTFALNGDDRTPGATVVGTSPEVGTGTWQSVNGYAGVFGATGGLNYPKDGNGNVTADLAGYIPVAMPANEVLSLSVTFNFNGSANANYNRMFIAFNGPNGVGFYGQSVLFDNQGNIDLFDTTITPVATTTYPSLNLNTTYTLTMNYDPTANTASVDVNGVQVIAATSLGSHTFGNGVDGVDFFTYDPTANPNLTISKIEVDAAAVPEPSSLALMLTGGLALAVLARRKIRTV